MRKKTSRPTPKTYARIYCTAKERKLWTQTAQNQNYETFTDFARTAIELLCANSHLPKILEKNRNKSSDENLTQIMRILAQIETQVRD